jgi:hypothetical protein
MSCSHSAHIVFLQQMRSATSLSATQRNGGGVIEGCLEHIL